MVDGGKQGLSVEDIAVGNNVEQKTLLGNYLITTTPRLQIVIIKEQIIAIVCII